MTDITPGSNSCKQDILQQIVAAKREEVASLSPMLQPRCSPIAEPKSLRQALLSSPTGIIAEFKRRSPSKGWIKEEGQASVIPLAYQQNGAAAVSILTDEKFFGGHDDFIRTARQSGVTIPVLYKNFIIDDLQLCQAARCGASAVLLIAACLSMEQCGKLIDTAHSLQLEVLLEMHSEEELQYASLQPDLCGINNRNLGSFVTDVTTSFRMAERLHSACSSSPQQPLLVSESGISSPQTVKALRQAGFSGFLIGETFMKADDPGEALRNFIQQL